MRAMILLTRSAKLDERLHSNGRPSSSFKNEPPNFSISACSTISSKLSPSKNKDFAEKLRDSTASNSLKNSSGQGAVPEGNEKVTKHKV